MKRKNINESIQFIKIGTCLRVWQRFCDSLRKCCSLKVSIYFFASQTAFTLNSDFTKVFPIVLLYIVCPPPRLRNVRCLCLSNFNLCNPLRLHHAFISTALLCVNLYLTGRPHAYIPIIPNNIRQSFFYFKYKYIYF